jgi:hypothetical protein
MMASKMSFPTHKIATGNKAATILQKADVKNNVLLVRQISLKKRGIKKSESKEDFSPIF